MKMSRPYRNYLTSSYKSAPVVMPVIDTEAAYSWIMLNFMSILQVSFCRLCNNFHALLLKVFELGY